MVKPIDRARVAAAVAISAAVLASTACDGFVDTGYRGEPLARISGVVVSERATPLPALDVGILWYALGADPYEPAAPILLDESIPVASQFPSGFELELHTPPVNALGSSPITPEVYEAEGIVALVARETDGSAIAGDVVAMDERYSLLYLAAALDPATAQARQHCGALASGYHLMEKTCEEADGCEAPPTYPPDGEECGDWEAADGMATAITLYLR